MSFLHTLVLVLHKCFVTMNKMHITQKTINYSKSDYYFDSLYDVLSLTSTSMHSISGVI